MQCLYKFDLMHTLVSLFKVCVGVQEEEGDLLFVSGDRMEGYFKLGLIFL